MASVRKNRLVIIALFAMFFGPALVAWYLSQFAGWRPGGTTNHGVFVSPAVEIKQWQFSEFFVNRSKGFWNLVVLTDDECASECQKWVMQTHQARLALDKDSIRVKRWIWSPEAIVDAALANQSDEPLVFSLSRDQYSTVLTELNQQAIELPRIFLVDPYGFVILRYDTPNASHVLRDMERLLKVGNEDVEMFQRSESSSGE